MRLDKLLWVYDNDDDFNDKELVSRETRYHQCLRDLPSIGPGLVKYDPNYDYNNCKFK